MNELVLARGMRDTRETLELWNRRPGRTLAPWLGLSLGIAVTLLAAVWAIAELSAPDPTMLALPGVTEPAELADVGHVLYRNSLVLALHAMACVAGFMAGSSLPQSAARRTGLSRWVHDKAGPLAIAFVVAATLFSLCTQAYVIGGGTATLARQLDVGELTLLLGLLPHALPELVALFLPLAAWTVASRRGQWHQLLAATVVTVALAAPVLLAAAFVEVYVSPGVLASLGAR